jgi:hypothetical protein
VCTALHWQGFFERVLLDGAQTPQRSGVTSNINVVKFSTRIAASIPSTSNRNTT